MKMNKNNSVNIIKQLWRHAEEESHLNVYAILDAARDVRIYRKLGNYSCEYLCLLTDRLPDELAHTAPYLVKLKKDAVFTKWLIKNGWGNSWGSFALTPEDLFDAVTHFRKFIKVKDEKGNILYFRYYDPRVMRVYLPTCVAKEFDFVFGNVKYYLMEDEKKDIVAFSFDKTNLKNEIIKTIVTG